MTAAGNAGPWPAGAAEAGEEIRELLAAVTGRPELLRCPPDVALFGDGAGLDSLTGTLLLRRIRDRFGVDVAAEDLNLDSLATLATLAAFVAGLAAGPAAPDPTAPDPAAPDPAASGPAASGPAAPGRAGGPAG